MRPALSSPLAPRSLLSRPSGPEPPGQGERMRAGEGGKRSVELGGEDVGEVTLPKGTPFQPESISNRESSVSYSGCKT